MKLLKIAWLLAIASSAIFASCKKDKTDEEQLPPITQTGANTFGCLINGKIYTPKGFQQNKPNFNIIVDPGFQGNLDLRTFSIENEIQSAFGFSSFNINSASTYNLDTSQVFPYFSKDINSPVCYFTSSNANYHKGVLIITRYDLTNRIISGEFNFKLYDPSISCDTIRITQGRFDKQF
ncbi:MAG: hypothetical protein LH615_03475 [Ferruginibacter sp.]|nr:hypothetical protein [Ferruginibacter sp.]